MVRFVHSRIVQIALLVMLLIDVVALVCELIIDSEYPVGVIRCVLFTVVLSWLVDLIHFDV